MNKKEEQLAILRTVLSLLIGYKKEPEKCKAMVMMTLVTLGDKSFTGPILEGYMKATDTYPTLEEANEKMTQRVLQVILRNEEDTTEEEIMTFCRNAFLCSYMVAHPLHVNLNDAPY